VYFCDLSEARSLDGIHLAVSLALGVPLGTDDPAVQIGHAIAGRGTCLIVLDNFEQLVALARATVGRWSERAPHASFVVTSRERLQLPGEQLFELEPLRLHTDAIELFECRARQQQADFAVDAANRDHVAEVARLLDGLPLAIELAAARVRVLPPRQLIRRLQDRFGVLAGSRGAVPRHVTLKATIDWSWELLSPWEQAGLAQCSVFEGGFALETAEAVLDLSSWPEAPSTLDVIQALLDKSLLRSWTTGSPSGPSEQRRFGMYLSIQEYAAGRLTQASDAASSLAALRHGQHFARLGTEPEIEALASREGVARRAALERDIDNLVVACRRALTRRDGEVAVRAYVACSLVLQWRGPYALCVALGAQVLGLPDLAPPLRIAALGARASVSGLVGLSQEAMSGLDEAASLAQATSDRKLLIDVLVHQGNLSLESGNAPVAIARYDAALAILRERPDRRREAWALGNRARAATLVGQVDAAHEAYSASIAIDRELGDRASEGVSLGNLSMALLNQGRFDAALPMLEQALAIHRDVGHRRHEVLVLNNIANVLMLQGRLEAAEERYRQALSIARDAGFRNDEGTLLGNLANFDELRGDLAKAREQHIAALTIERETGARQQQCVSHINLAMLDHALGTLGEAREHYERALAICRESGNPRLEGVALGGLAALLLDLGELAAARAAQQQASLFLRHVNDTFELARLTCVRGLIEAAEGDVEQARRTLLEAQAAADEVGAGPRSEVGRAIERLRAVVG